MKIHDLLKFVLLWDNIYKACKILVFVSVSISITSVSGQGSCQNPIPLTIDSNGLLQNNYYMANSELWFYFQANNNNIFLAPVLSDSTPAIYISGIKIFSGTCQALQLIAQSDGNLTIDTNCLIVNSYYFLKLEKSLQTPGWVSFITSHLVPDWGICAFTEDQPQPSCCIKQAEGVNVPDPNDCIIIGICENEEVSFFLNDPLYNHVEGLNPNYYYYRYEFVQGPVNHPPSNSIPANLGVPWPDPQQNYTTTFSTAGYYKIKLAVYYAGGFLTEECGPFWIEVYDLPEVFASSNSPVCEGNEIQLFSNTNTPNIQWTGPNGFNSTQQNPVIQNCSLQNAGTYNITVANEHCENLSSVDVTIENPIVNAEGTSPICVGNTLFLTATANMQGSFSWTGPNGFFSTQQNPVLTNVSSADAGVYTVVFTTGNNCQATDTYYVDIQPGYVTASINGNNNNCNSTTDYFISGVSSSAYYDWTIYPPYGQIITSSSGFGVSSITVTWIGIISNSDPAVITVVIDGGTSCETTITMKVFNCCNQLEADVILNNEKITSDITYHDLDISINGELIIESDVVIENDDQISSQVFFGPEAKINIMPNGKLTIKGNVILREGCFYMWDGIYVNDPSASINIMDIFDKPQIRDALNAVVSKNGGIFNISEAEFYNNNKAIVISDYNATIPSYMYPYQGLIKNCDFANINTNYLLQFPPLNSKYSLAGIEIIDVDGLLLVNPFIGFYNLSSGIISKNSNVQVNNARFENIPVQAQIKYPPKNAAIYAINDFSNPAIPTPKLITGMPQNQYNQFNFCKLGIFVINQTSELSNNGFANCNDGIFCLNPWYPTWITDNYLNSTPETYGTAIQVKSTGEYHLPTELDLKINNNIILGSQNGISMINQNSKLFWAEVQNNTITFNQDMPPNTYRSGINVENCDNSLIISNTLTRVNSNLNATMAEHIRGIRISRSFGSWAVNNEFTHMGSGIYTNGELFNTQFPCNTFNDCYHGFKFGVNTVLSDQGGLSSWNPDNAFYGNYQNPQYRLSTEPGNLTGSPINWFVTSDLNDLVHLLDPNINVPGHPCFPAIWSIPNGTNSFCNLDFLDLAGVDDTNKREIYYGSYLRGESQYSALTDQYKSYERHMLYRSILRNPSLLTLGGYDDIAYQLLFDSLSGGHPGVRENILRCFKEMKLDSASYFNNLLGEGLQWLANEKQTNAVIYRSWARTDYELSTEDSLALLEIALQTPYEGGDAVYTARVMLGLEPLDYGTPYRGSTETESSMLSLLKTWPNPVSDFVSLELTNNSDVTLTAEMYTVTGGLAYTYTFTKPGSLISLDTRNCKPGLYLLRLQEGNFCRGTAKLCIIH
ncbi:MAG: hypothetical protein AB9842_10480 [Bacteroidales bacterium]